MKKLDNTTIEVDGKTYYHDPDFDIYFRVHDVEPESLKVRVVKISIAVAVLAAIIYFFT